MYLSYSGFKSHGECPRVYWHRYIDKTQTPERENRVHVIYGSVVGLLFEEFYNHKLWRCLDVKQALLRRIPYVVEHVVAQELKSGVLDWSDPTLKPDTRSLEVVQKCVEETVDRGLRIIKFHRLLGPESFAEVELDSEVGSHTFGGRADFLIRRVAPYGDFVLLDGKGSRWRETYVDTRQLLWYAMLLQMRTGSLPDRLGFLFWRSEPENSVDWAPFVEADIHRLKENVLEMISSIEEGKRFLSKVGDTREAIGETFPTRIGPNCLRCSYKAICPEGRIYGEKRAPTQTAVGVEDIGF